MHKNTFFNLDKEKQGRIIEAAMSEFANNSFKKATIDNIVNSAAIPKGSFYQYFYDKKDIYKYLFLKISKEKKQVLVDNLFQMNEMNFTSFIRNLYKAGKNYDFKDMSHIDLSEKFMLNCSNELREEILEEMIPESNDLFSLIISNYIDKGELKADINIPALSNMLTTLTLFVSKNYHARSIDQDQILKDIDSMLYIIEHGILKED